tara:strand:- start:1169 stop:1507 length:339 start_codon:yes stop_codon:yes gene_type:complete
MKLKLLIGIILFSSCGKLPLKPEIISRLIIMDENIIYNVNNQTGEEWEEILVYHNNNKPVVNDSLDLNTCHSNEGWGKILTYIRLLESHTPRKIRKELKKIVDIRELKKVSK